MESILRERNIEPFGTVGKYSASPESIAESMQKKIPMADLVVFIATPRYIRQDVKTGEISHGLPEMVHVETGIAYALNKPVVVIRPKRYKRWQFSSGRNPIFGQESKRTQHQVAFDSGFAQQCIVLNKKNEGSRRKFRLEEPAFMGLGYRRRIETSQRIFSEVDKIPIEMFDADQHKYIT